MEEMRRRKKKGKKKKSAWFESERQRAPNEEGSPISIKRSEHTKHGSL